MKYGIRPIAVKILLLSYVLINCYSNLFGDQKDLETLVLGLQSLSNIVPLEQNNGQKFDFKNTVISINHTVENFNRTSSCDLHTWANKLENACKCCLIQNAPELDIGKQPSEILQTCINKKECDSTVIQEMLNQEKIAYRNKERNLRELISHLYNKSVIVKEVLPHDIKFNPDGSFTEVAAKEFLAQAYEEKKLRNPHFRSASCLTAKDILSQKGFMTSQLFLITSDCSGPKNDYILKEMAAGSSEIIYLERSSLIPGLNTYIYPSIVQGFPSFILPLAYISYNYGGKEHYLSLMLKAPGILLSSLVEKYKNNIISPSEIERAYYQTGFTLSNFHQKFMSDFKSLAKPGQLLSPTYVQGDAHQSNIFYDSATNQVIFIDNEKFTVRSPRNPFLDLETFIFVSLKVFIPESIRNDVNFLNNWIFLTIKNFLRGYIDAYKINERPRLLDELILNFNNPYSYFNQYSYHEYQNKKETFDKIFSELRNEYK